MGRRAEEKGASVHKKFSRVNEEERGLEDTVQCCTVLYSDMYATQVTESASLGSEHAFPPSLCSLPPPAQLWPCV